MNLTIHLKKIEKKSKKSVDHGHQLINIQHPFFCSIHDYLSIHDSEQEFLEQYKLKRDYSYSLILEGMSHSSHHVVAIFQKK